MCYSYSVKIAPDEIWRGYVDQLKRTEVKKQAVSDVIADITVIPALSIAIPIPEVDMQHAINGVSLTSILLDILMLFLLGNRLSLSF